MENYNNVFPKKITDKILRQFNFNAFFYWKKLLEF